MKKIIEDFMNSFDGDFTEQSLPRSHQKHPFLMTSWGVPDEELDRRIYEFVEEYPDAVEFIFKQFNPDEIIVLEREVLDDPCTIDDLQQSYNCSYLDAISIVKSWKEEFSQDQYHLIKSNDENSDAEFETVLTGDLIE